VEEERALYTVHYDDGDVLPNVPASMVVSMSAFQVGTALYARQNKGRLYRRATVMAVDDENAAQRSWTYTLLYSDISEEPNVSTLYIRREQQVVARHHKLLDLEVPAAPQLQRSAAPASLGGDLMRSVLELLQGKTSLTMNLGAAQQAQLMGGPGGAENVLQALRTALGGDLDVETFGGRCRLQPPSPQTCEAEPIAHWGEAAEQYHRREMHSPHPQEMSLSLPGVSRGKTQVRVMLLPAHHTMETQQLLQELGAASGNRGQVGPRPMRYWGAGTFYKELELSREEMLEVEHDIMTSARTNGFIHTASAAEDIAVQNMPQMAGLPPQSGRLG